jgi:hypothetical protein
MSENEWVLKSVEPKSDQLNADDLIAGPMVVKVVDVKKGTPDQPVVIEIDGGRQPYKPCKSMRRVLISVWGDTPKNWIGKSMRLYCDSDVRFGGMKVGGIRISHMTGIKSRQELMLTVTRGKRAAHVIEPLEVAAHATDDTSARVTKAIEFLGTVATHDALAKAETRLDELVKTCSPDDKKRLMAAHTEAVRRLKEAV